MPQFLLVIEAKSRAPIYTVLLDVLERRLGARRILRTAWVIEADSVQSVYDSLVFYRPYDDGMLVLPFTEPRVERNLRGAQRACSNAAADEKLAVSALNQQTPL